MNRKLTQVSQKDYRVIEDTLIALDCARSLTVLILLRHNQFEDILSLEFNPHSYNDLSEARAAYCSTELLRKNRFINVESIDKEGTALAAFHECESVCRDTNIRLLRGNPEYSSLLFVMSKKIAEILGDLNYDEIVVSSGWGPGVTLTLKSGHNTLFEKFRHYGEVTPAFSPIASRLCKAICPLWENKPRIYEGNRVITVPKNAKTDRVIAVEPSINLFFQKGVGAVIRKRLKRWGIDLTDQRRNQALSRAGSFDGSLSTVDFSSASDTISYALILQCLPFNWFSLLDVLRSPRGFVQNRLIEYEKFSSMGNGFTFELESLIFYAAALAVAQEAGIDSHQISVYGDDVIIPTILYSAYSDFCSHLGFKVNNRKSFNSSYFRESCGGYFWNGVSIKPIRLLESLSSPLGEHSFHNRLYEYDYQEEFQTPIFSGVRALIKNGSRSKCCVPPSFGDQGFRMPARVFLRNGKLIFKAQFEKPKLVSADDLAVLLAHLYNQDWRSIDEENLTSQTSRFFHGINRPSLIPSGNECQIARQGRTTVRTVVLPYGVADYDKV